MTRPFLFPAEDDAAALTYAIAKFVQDSTDRNSLGYQCLLCAVQSRDFFNHRTHLLKHMRLEEAALWEDLERFCADRAIIHSDTQITCKMCRKVVTRRAKVKNDIFVHFITKHLSGS